MIDELDQTILASFPYFIAIKYKEMLDAIDYKGKVSAATRTFELSVRTLATAIVTQYLKRDYDLVIDHEMNQLLETRLPNALLQVWLGIVFLGIKAYSVQRDLLFIPELYDLYWDRESSPPVQRPGIESPFKRLVEIRDLSVDPEQQPKDSNGWKILYEEAYELLRGIMHKFLFLKDYRLIHIVRHDDDRHWYTLHAGLEIITVQEPIISNVDLHDGWFYLVNPQQEFLSLHPLLIVWQGELENKDIAIYERYIREDNLLKYIATRNWQLISDQTNVADFVWMLYRTLEEHKRGKEKYETLTWWKLQEIAQRVSELKMSSVRGKYDKSVYLQREKTRTEVERFLESEKTCFVLLGKSGVGKSNFLISLTEEFVAKRSSVCLLYYDAAKLFSGKSLTDTISQDFDRFIRWRHKDFVGNIWDEIELIPEIENKLVVLLLDAINENPAVPELLRRIDDLGSLERRSWLKVLVTCRPEVWQTVVRRTRLAEDNYFRGKETGEIGVEMAPFSYSHILDELSYSELPLAYEMYKAKFLLQTEFSSLPLEIRRALRDPFLLLLVSFTYQASEVPKSLTLKTIYDQYLDGLTKAGKVTGKDLRLLTQEIVPLMMGAGRLSNALTAAQIDVATTRNGIPLFELIHNDGLLPDGSRVNQSYVNLVDAGILTQRGTPLDYQIGFRYERFYDYYVGEWIYRSNSERANKLEEYAKLAHLLPEKPYLWGAIKFALTRELEFGQESLIVQLCGESDIKVRQLMTSVLKEYGLVDLNLVHRILSKLLASEPRVFLSSLTRLKRSEIILGQKRVAIQVAGSLGLPDILAKAARDTTSSIRLDALRQIFYLWRMDKNEGEPEHQNRGIKALQELSNTVPRLVSILVRRSNAAIAEAVLGVSLLMFFEAPDDATTRLELAKIWRAVLDRVMSINTRLGLLLVRTLGEIELPSVIVGFVSKITTEAPRYNVGSLEEFGSYFDLPDSKRDWLRCILPYADPNHGNIEDVGFELLKGIFENDDLISGAGLSIVLVGQGRKRPAEILELTIRLFEEIHKGSPRGAIAIQYLCGTLYQVMRSETSLDESFWKIADRFARVPLDKTKGVLFSRTGRQHFCIGFIYIALLYLEKTGHPGLHLWKHYLTTAIAEKDWDFVDDLLFIAGQLALAYRSPSATLEIIREISSTKDEVARRKILHTLSRVRFYYPNIVDEYLDAEGYSDQEIPVIQSDEVEESIAQILYFRFINFFSDGWQQGTIQQEVFSALLYGAVNSSSFGRWINFITHLLVNKIYGQEIFPIEEVRHS